MTRENNRHKTHYFGAGPAPLPTHILEAASHALLDYQCKGIGLCEISHRSKDALNILRQAKNDLREFAQIPEADFEILFLQGGGTGQFSAVVSNVIASWVGENVKPDEQNLNGMRQYVEKNLILDYIVTGAWSDKACHEAIRLVGAQKVNIVVNSKKFNSHDAFDHIPQQNNWKLSRCTKTGRPNAAFIYFCDNETVDGIEFPEFPEILKFEKGSQPRPCIVADMSSNFLSRELNIDNFDVVFAGAQKNVGSAGITILVVRKTLLDNATRASPDLLRSLNLPISPIIMDWPTVFAHESLYNTLPIMDLWLSAQVIADLKRQFGVNGLVKHGHNILEKSRLIYTVLDAFPHVYCIVPRPEHRSRINICFRILDTNGVVCPLAETDFLHQAEHLDLFGMAGHRSVGGIRISNYNAVRNESVQRLVQFLREFAQCR